MIVLDASVIIALLDPKDGRHITTGLRMPDCCVLAVARQEGLPLATFDQQLAHAAQRLGIDTLG
jgi:predicted nucleic acid-binding protein